MATPWKSIEESEEFKRLSKAEKLNVAQEWIRSTDSELKAASGYTPEYSARLGEFGAGILKKINQAEEKGGGGFWESAKNFARDLAEVPAEIVRGAESTSDQVRMFGNFLQGDREELESLYRKQYAYEPLEDAKTTVGGWVRGAANTLPYMGAAAAAGTLGGLGGSLLAPGAGTTAGAGLGAASVGFAQGWGEMYGRLRNEGIDPETAADIALAVAPAYAGIEAVQIRKIPGAAQLADKYLTGAFKKILASKLTDKAFRGKVQRALGEYAGEIISQSAEEGAQEMALNAGEQYGRNGGFRNFDFGENLGAGAEAFKETIGPFAVIQGANVPIRLARRAILPRETSSDLEALKEAVEEGKNIQEVPEGVGNGETFIGGDGRKYRNVDGTAVAVYENGNAEESETAYLEKDLAEEKESKEELPAGKKIKNGKIEKTYTSEIAKNIDALEDENMRLDAIEFEYEQGNINELTDDQLEFAAGHGYEFAERELFRRTQEGIVGAKLLDFMKQNNIRLPTPAAIRRHANEHNRDLSTYLYGEIKDLYDSLPFNLRGRYFTKNYVNLDETAQELAYYGFKFDGESDFITKVADNLWEKETSYGFSLKPKRLSQSIGKGKYAGLNDNELVKAHRAAFEANDKAAGEEINAEWMRRKGYETKAYHGTGADGFNVADATSKYEANGEGAQAHGQGLYMAADRNTAIGYRGRANKTPVVKLGGKTIDYKEMGFSSLDELIDEVYELRENNPLRDTPKSILNSFSQKLDYWRAESEKARKEIALGKGYGAENLKEAQEQIAYIEEDAKKLQKWAKVFGEGQTIKDLKVVNGFGRVFDWFHNMKPDEMFDEGKYLSEQPEVFEKYKEAWDEDIAPIIDERIAEYMESYRGVYDVESFARAAERRKEEVSPYSDNEKTRYAFDSLAEYLGADRFREIMLKHGIRGITYEGRQDGRAFVSFEGGPAVKLQDAFTFDDDGKYIPLNKRGNNAIPDMRYSIKERNQGDKTRQESAKIKKAVETSYRQMYKNAARKPEISWVENAEELRKKYPQFEISDNCEAAITDGKITFVAENLESPRRAVEVFLHESVGHFGLEEMLGEDFNPFAAYIIKHYKGRDLWNEISERYGTKDNKTIAREMIAHLAESRELSDPSMWRRMTEYVRRKLGRLGLGKAYSEMLNEEILRAAIRASRQWSKGDLAVNNAGIWELIGKTTKPKDGPEDEMLFSLIGVDNENNLNSIDKHRRKSLEKLLNEAKNMEAQGASRSDIYRKTGWENVETGEGSKSWTYDVNEGKIDFDKLRSLNETTVGNIMKDCQLFEVCPYIKDTKIKWDLNGDNYDGMFDSETNTIYLNPKHNKSNNDLRETLIHEIQHKIDYKNFDGGDPDSIGKFVGLASYALGASRFENDKIKKAKLLEYVDSVCSAYNLTRKEIEAIQTPKDARTLGKNIYYALVGERRAFNAEERTNYSKRKRRRYLISTTEEISRIGSYSPRNLITIQEPIVQKILDLKKEAISILNDERGSNNTRKERAIPYESLWEFSKGGASHNYKRHEGESLSNQSNIGKNYHSGDKQASKNGKRELARSAYSSRRGIFTQAYIDKYHPLAVLERVVKGGIQDASKSAWKMALMTANIDQVMFHALEKGGLKYDKNTGEFSAREETEGLAKILNPLKGKNYRNFENYAKAKSALERWEFLKNKENFKDKRFLDTFGFTENDARKWESEANAASKKAFEGLQKFFQSNRDFMLETGLISEQQHAALSKFKNYVPFFREGKDLEAETEAAYEKATELFPGGKGFSGRNAGIREFEGSSRATKNLVENIINQTRHVMEAGYKNIAAARSLNLMREAGLAKYIRQDSAEAKAKMEDLKRSLEKEGVNVGGLSDEDIRRKVPIEAYFDILNDKNDDIVSCRINGILTFYKVEDPELLVAVKNLGGEKFSKAWKLLTGPKNLMTFAITKLPQFAIRNFIRDTGSNAILFGGKTIVPYMAHTMKNLGKSVFSDGHLQKMWAAGAGGGSWYSVKADDIASDFKDGAWNKIKKAGKYTLLPISKVLEKYERLLSASEQANRLSRFDQAKKAGASDMEAAFQAMDVLNFGMKGSGVWTGKSEWAKAGAAVFNAIVRITPFLNARIQGLYKLWRETGAEAGIANQTGDIGVKNRTRSFIQTLSKAVLMRGMMMSAASVLYSIYANNSEDDDGEKWYEKLPTHDKLNYWHFYLGDNNIVRIPKPFEVGYVFATIPEIMTDTAFQKRPEVLKTLWKGMVQQLEFNPLANPIFDTFVEQTNNKDSFTGRPLIEYADRELSPKYQYDADTSATAKAIAQVFGNMGLGESWLASPARVQNVMGNLLAGMTKYVTAMTDSIVESLTDIEGGTSRYARESVFEAPYSWAMRNTRTMNTKNSEDFYELRARTREIYGAARLLRQEKKMEQLQNLIDRHKAELGNYNYVNAVNTRLAEISRARKALAERKDLSNEEIIHQDDLYLAERNRLLAMTDILLDNLEKEKFDLREFKDILSRINDAGKDRKASRKSQRLIQRLAQME